MGYDEAYLMIGVLSITISSILSYIAFLININIKKHCIASFISLCISASIIIFLFLAKVAWAVNIDLRLYFLSVAILTFIIMQSLSWFVYYFFSQKINRHNLQVMILQQNLISKDHIR